MRLFKFFSVPFLVFFSFLLLIGAGCVNGKSQIVNSNNASKAQSNFSSMVNPAWETFTSSTNFILQYPKGYKVTEKTLNPGMLVVTLELAGTENRLALFKKSDFKNNSPTWVFPEFSVKSNQYLPVEPREELTLGEADKAYGAWLYYAPNDTSARDELKKIVATVKLK